MIRRILAIAFCFTICFVAVVYAATAIVQPTTGTRSCASASGGATCAITMTSTAGGNKIVVLCYQSGSTICAVPTDNVSNTYAADVSTFSAEGFGIYSCTNCTAAATTITCHPGTAGFWVACIATELSGVATTSPIDGTPNCTTATAATYASSAMTTSSAGSIVLGGASTGGSASAGFAATAGWSVTQAHQGITGDGDDVFGVQYKNSVAAGSYTLQGTLGSSLSIHTCIVAYKAASGGGGTRQQRRR